MWNNATTREIEECTLIANSWIQDGPFLLSEIRRALDNSAGTLSWSSIAQQMAGSGNLQPISENSTHQIVMSLPESLCESTQILPMLTEDCKTCCFWWVQQWEIFWHSAVNFFPGVQVFLMHALEECKTCSIPWHQACTTSASIKIQCKKTDDNCHSWLHPNQQQLCWWWKGRKLFLLLESERWLKLLRTLANAFVGRIEHFIVQSVQKTGIASKASNVSSVWKSLVVIQELDRSLNLT